MNNLEDDISRVYGNQPLDGITELTVPINLINTDEKAEALKTKFPNLTSITVTGSENWPAGEQPNNTICGISNWADTLTSVDISSSNAESIGEGAFAGLDNVTSDNLKLTDTITSVGDNAFEGTAALDKDNFESLKNLETIGSGAFANTGIGTTITVPGKVASIGTGAFAGLGGTNTGNALTVDLPAAVAENIDDFFTESENHEQSVFINDLTITKSETGDSIVGSLAGKTENGTFDANRKPNTLADLVITGNVTVEEGVTAVGDNAFVGIGAVDGTLDVSLPDSITSIGEDAFNGASLVVDDKGIIQGEGEEAETGKLVIEGGKLPAGVTIIGEGAFENSGLVSPGKDHLDISGFLDNGNDTQIKEIGKDAFAGVNIGDESDVIIPDTVTSVGDGSFAVVKDENGTPAAGTHPGISITIPGNAIGKNPCAEEGQGLDDIFLPSGDSSKRPAHFGTVTITGDKGESFDTCKLTGEDDSGNDGVDIILDKLVVDNGITNVTVGSFENIGVRDNGVDSKLDIDLTKVPGTITINGPFTNGPKVVNGSGTVTEEIGKINFIPDGLLPSTSSGITIGNGAFKQDDPSTGSSYPSNSVGDPFWNAEDPSTGDAGKIVTVNRIGDEAFAGNTAVKRITIPKECTYIGKDAFKGCTNLEEIIFEGERDTPIEIAEGAFNGCSNLKYVSSLDQNGYKKNGTDGEIEFPEWPTIEKFNKDVFANTGITSVVLPDGVSSVDNNAFDTGTSYEVTVPVKGFMNVNEGDSVPTEPVEVTFNGTFPSTITSVSADGSDDGKPTRYGYDAKWSVLTEDGSYAQMSISDLIKPNGEDGNKGYGPEVTWTAKEFTNVTISLPEGWEFADGAGRGGSETLTISVEFGQSLSEAIQKALETAHGTDAVIINNSTGNYVNLSDLIFPEGFVDDNGNLSKELEGENSEFTVGISGAGTAYDYPISIVGADGQTHTDTINKGTTWAKANIDGVTIPSGTYISTTAPDSNTGKPSSTSADIVDANTEITVPTAEGPYYNYAKVTVTTDGTSSGEQYYQVGTSTDKILPSEDAGTGNYWKVEGTGVISDDGTTIVGSGTVTITKTPCEYKLSIDGSEVNGVTVTYGQKWNIEYSEVIATNNTGYILSSAVTGNGPFTDDQLIGNGSYTTVPVPADGETIELAKVSKLDGYSYSDMTVIAEGWYKADATITLPQKPSNLSPDIVFIGWKVGEEILSPGDTVSVADILNGGITAFVEEKKAYIITLDDSTQITVYEGDSWGTCLPGLSDGTVKYYINNSSVEANGIIPNLGSSTISATREFKVTYKTPNSSVGLIAYDSIGSMDAQTVSEVDVWVKYGTSVENIDAPIAKYAVGSATVFNSWNYGGVATITEPKEIGNAISEKIENGLDIANPYYMYLKIGGDTYEFYMQSAITSTYSSQYNGYSAIDAAFAEKLLNLTQEQKNIFSAWMAYWITYYAPTAGLNDFPYTSNFWVDGKTFNGNSAIEVEHTMLYYVDGVFKVGQDFNDIVEYIKANNEFPVDCMRGGRKQEADINILVEISEYVGSVPNASAIYYRKLN